VNKLEMVAICEQCRWFIMKNKMRACEKIKMLGSPAPWAWEQAIEKCLCPDSRFGPQINPADDFMGILLDDL